MLRGILIISGTVLALCAVLAGLAVSAFSRNPCANRVVAEATAPSGQWTAVVFERSCGAATARVGQMISVLSADEPFPQDPEHVGNVFRVDNWGPGAGGRSPTKVGAAWASDSLLVIEHSARAHVLFAVLRDHGIRVRYDTLP